MWAKQKHFLNANFCRCSAEVYDQVTHFLQGYIDSEINFNEDRSCTSECGDYRQTRNLHCADETMCAEDKRMNDTTVCNGDIYDCSEMGSIETAVCHTGSDDPLHRYSYIEYSNGQILGQKLANGTCAVLPKVNQPN